MRPVRGCFLPDTVSFANRDDVLTYLIHLGYLAYDQDREQVFIPNEEIRHELNNAVKRNKWNEMITFQKESADLLDATLDMDEKAVADGIERIHQEYSSVIQYNDENSLSSEESDSGTEKNGNCSTVCHRISGHPDHIQYSVDVSDVDKPEYE